MKIRNIALLVLGFALVMVWFFAPRATKDIAVSASSDSASVSSNIQKTRVPSPWTRIEIISHSGGCLGCSTSTAIFYYQGRPMGERVLGAESVCKYDLLEIYSYGNDPRISMFMAKDSKGFWFGSYSFLNDKKQEDVIIDKVPLGYVDTNEGWTAVNCKK